MFGKCANLQWRMSELAQRLASIDPRRGIGCSDALIPFNHPRDLTSGEHGSTKVGAANDTNGRGRLGRRARKDRLQTNNWTDRRFFEPACRAVFALNTGLNILWYANWIRQSGSQRIISSFNTAAVGTALRQANGMQVLDRSRQALCGDGGFNMLICECLTAVHHKLPVKVVISNNAAFAPPKVPAR